MCYVCDVFFSLFLAFLFLTYMQSLPKEHILSIVNNNVEIWLCFGRCLHTVIIIIKVYSYKKLLCKIRSRECIINIWKQAENCGNLFWGLMMT